MKTFSEYIYESSDKEYSEFLKNCAIVSGLTDTTSYYIDDLEDMIYANKPIDKVMGYFKKYDKPCAEMEAFAKSDKAGRWKVEGLACSVLSSKVGSAYLVLSDMPGSVSV